MTPVIDLSPKPARALLERVHRIDLSSCSDEGLKDAFADLGEQARLSGVEEVLPPVFAIVSEVVNRRLALRPTDEQLLAGMHLFNGSIVQMNAGEGKTVAGAFAAVFQAALGRSVHVVTANEYLAARDAELLTPVYESLGISVGAVIGYMDDGERRHNYRKDVVYGPMREFGFDFLRDNLKTSGRDQVQRGFDVAIVDEVDHALIDEAFTPMIISGSPLGTRRATSKVKKAVNSLISLQRDIAQGLANQLTASGLITPSGAASPKGINPSPPSFPPAQESNTSLPSSPRSLSPARFPAYAGMTGKWGRESNPSQSSFPPSRESINVAAKLLLADPHNTVLRRYFADNPERLKRAKLAAESLLTSPHSWQDGDLSPLLYAIDPDSRYVTLTESGRDDLAQTLGPFYDGTALEAELDVLRERFDLPLTERRRKAKEIGRRLARQYGLGNQVYQMLRAYLLLKRDVDYLVNDGSLVLIDRATGRPKVDFVYQHGLQSALEMKEELTPRPETETLGQITVEGLVKRYKHLSGMTGTATGSADEFQRRYGLRVVELPPSNPLRRIDLPDRVYLNNNDKNGAIVDQVVACRRVGQPVLVGTITVEDSQELSRLLRERGIPHNLLNAVTSEEEARIVRGAGAFGAVTVATNMAGRGTDILLEPGLNDRITRRCAQTGEAIDPSSRLSREACPRPGFPPSRERQGKGGGKPDEAGHFMGLRVIGSEVNKSARIDLQLNGRSGRQGESGVTQTFLSLEDRLLGFHAESILKMRKHRKVDEAGRAFFEGKAVDELIDSVQKTAEHEAEAQRGLMQDYASVLDRHTDFFYQHRRQVMEPNALPQLLARLTNDVAARLAADYLPEVTLESYPLQFGEMADEILLDYRVDCSLLKGCDLTELPGELGALFVSGLEEMESRLGTAGFASLSRLIYLRTCDDLWKTHLVELQEAVSNQMLSGHSHKSAVARYVSRSFKAWDEFMGRVKSDFLSRLLAFPIDRMDSQPSLSPVFPAQAGNRVEGRHPPVQLHEDVRALIAQVPMAHRPEERAGHFLPRLSRKGGNLGRG